MKKYTILIHNNSLLPCLLAFFLSVFFLHADANEVNPGQIVKRTVDQVLSILKDKDLGEDTKRRFIYSIAREHIDFEGMSRRIVAISWRKASDDQKVEFIFLFEKVLLDYYWTRMKQYSGERVEYLAVSIEQEKYATVDTVVVRDDSSVEIPITYRMELKNGNWRAYDFLVENLSLVQNYNREYQAIIKNKGIDGLLEQMHSEI